MNPKWISCNAGLLGIIYILIAASGCPGINSSTTSSTKDDPAERLSPEIRAACIPDCQGSDDSVLLLQDLVVLLRRTGNNVTEAEGVIGAIDPSGNCNACARVVSQTVFFESIDSLSDTETNITEDMRIACIPDCTGANDIIHMMIILVEFGKRSGYSANETKETTFQTWADRCDPCIRVVVDTVYFGSQ